MGYPAQVGIGTQFWSVFWETLPPLYQIKQLIAALQGKIQPAEEQVVRTQATAAVVKAVGTSATEEQKRIAVTQVQQDITAALAPYGGSSLPEYGGSIWPQIAGVNIAWWLLGGLGVVGAILLIKD